VFITKLVSTISGYAPMIAISVGQIKPARVPTLVPQRLGPIARSDGHDGSIRYAGMVSARKGEDFHAVDVDRSS
jgi:hypothetical protein